jgi:hypothetical protein
LQKKHLLSLIAILLKIITLIWLNKIMLEDFRRNT